MSSFKKIDIKNVKGSSIKITIGSRSIYLQYANLIGIFAILISIGFLLYKLNTTDIKCAEIPNLDTKIESFEFNTTSNKDILNLKFISQKCDFQVDFRIPSSRKVEFLKKAIIRHFELEKHFVFSKKPDYLTWEITSNHRTLENEQISLEEAGVLNTDIVRLNIIRKYIDPAAPGPEKDSLKEIALKSFVIFSDLKIDDTIFINPNKILYHESWPPFKSYYFRINHHGFHGDLEIGINEERVVEIEAPANCFITYNSYANRIFLNNYSINENPQVYLYLEMDNQNERYLSRVHREIEDCKIDYSIKNGMFRCNIDLENLFLNSEIYPRYRNRGFGFLKEINFAISINSEANLN